MNSIPCTDTRLPPVLQALQTQYVNLLGDNLIGLYLHGSLGFGCFRWEASDIDIIAVVQSPVNTNAKLALLAVLEDLRNQAPPKGFEMSVVLADHCRSFIYPTPFQLHFSADWRARYQANPLSLCEMDNPVDHDLAAHFMVINQVGLVLWGKPIAQVFGPVPEEHYWDSIVRDIQDAERDIRHNPAYIILNLCRVLAWKQEKQVLSKEQGGLWGQAHLPAPHSRLAAAALARYRGEKAYTANPEAEAAFCRWMLAEITSGKLA